MNLVLVRLTSSRDWWCGEVPMTIKVTGKRGGTRAKLPSVLAYKCEMRDA